MAFERKFLKKDISVNSVISVHYFEYSKGFAFSGEFHDFWEIVYADRHKILVTAGAQEFTLNIGEMYLHRPMEFHNIRCDKDSIANSVIVSFESDCKELYNVAGRVITCDGELRRYMANIISEAKNAFSGNLGDPYDNTLSSREGQPFGSEQLILVNLEALLIKLIRRSSCNEQAPVYEQNTNEQQFLEICKYLQANCYERLSFNDICNHFGLSMSHIKRLFAARMDCGIMEYFGRCKIDAAKELIREKNLNFSGIASKLGYNTVQYFSRHFKSVTGMTPSQYASSVQAFMREFNYR